MLQFILYTKGDKYIAKHNGSITNNCDETTLTYSPVSSSVLFFVLSQRLINRIIFKWGICDKTNLSISETECSEFCVKLFTSRIL